MARSARLHVLVRVMVGASTVVAALAFIPLGLVLTPGRWVAGTVLAWLVATTGVAGLVRRHPAAYLTPLVLIAGWYAVQVLPAPAVPP